MGANEYPRSAGTVNNYRGESRSEQQKRAIRGKFNSIYASFPQCFLRLFGALRDA
jgi:hypothetical protein